LFRQATKYDAQKYVFICCKINPSVLINAQRFVSVPRQIARFSSPIAREACHEFVSRIGTQGDYRAVYFIEVADRRNEERTGREVCVPKCKFGATIQYRLRDQRTTWIRVRAQVCRACKSANVGNILSPSRRLYFIQFLYIYISADLRAEIRKKRSDMI